MADAKTLEPRKNVFPACCDIYHENDKVILRMEMPGVSKEKLNIQVNNDKLIIDGERTFPEAKGDYLMREIRHGDYHHEFSIDDTIDRNKIEAAIKNGLVTISLGIKESEKPRKIKVEVK